MNKYQNVRVLDCALGDFDGETGFNPGPTTLMGHVAADGLLRVCCSTADTLAAGGEVEAPDVIKIDVEGAEAHVLRGARRAMQRHPAIFLATHGEGVHRRCLDLLTACGYEVRAMDGGPPEGTNEVLAVAAGKVGA